MTRILWLLVASFLWLPSLHAWNPAAHRISSQIAWDELTPDVKKEVMRILRFHPRYDDDFDKEMPIDVRLGTKDDLYAWLFQQASVWPDMVRDLSDDNRRAEYNRSKWHWVNVPLFLSNADALALKDTISPNVETDPTLAEDPKYMNIFQAINYNVLILEDKNAPYGERAVALCWIAHLIQDIHQPLHTTALFTTGRFTDGDRGGNLIPVSDQGRRRNLHALWDNIISGNQSPTIIRKRAAFLSKVHHEMGINATEVMSTEAWARENQRMVTQYVYPKSITAEIKKMENKEEKLHPIRLEEEYRSLGQEIAEIRIVEAGFRLAYLLNQL
ncbi:MAG: S1/P1 nuclease [Arenicellales bacterium]|nr:S1/P1 nuclease [Arenicellales bacterium]